MRHERVRRIGGSDLVPGLELNDRAVRERIATENCACERARDITARNPRMRRNGDAGAPLREGHVDRRPATGLRQRNPRTRNPRTYDRRCGWRQRLASRRGEETKDEKGVFHGALH